MIDVTIQVPIEPKALQRPKAALIGGRARMFLPTESRRWQGLVAQLAAEKMPALPFDEPLRVDILVVLQRPQGLLRKKDPDGLVWCDKRPDRDNIEKNVLDALRACWRDDSLVVCGDVLKVYAERTGKPRMVIRIRSAGGIEPEDLASRLGLIDRRTRAVPAGLAPLPLFEPVNDKPLSDEERAEIRRFVANGGAR